MKRFFALLLAVILAMPLYVSAETGYVTVSVYSHLDESYIVEPTRIELTDGMTAFSVLRKLDVQFKHNSGYVTSINGLAEFGHGPYSGWVYVVDGQLLKVSAATRKLKAGETLQWEYAVTAEQAGLAGNTSSADKPEPDEPPVSSEAETSSQPAEDNSVYQSPSQIPEPDVSSQTESEQEVSSAETESAAEDEPFEQEESITDNTVQKTDADTLFKGAAEYLKKNPGDWTPLVYSLMGEKVPEKLLKNQSTGRITDTERRLIIARATGNLKTEEMADEITGYEKLYSEGLNSAIFAVIALNSAGKADTLLQLAGYIVSKQHPDGGFALFDGLESDVDMTAMAVCALLLCGGEEAKSACILAENWLGENMNEDGSFGSPASCESTAQALIALALSGADEKLLDKISAALAEFKAPGGGFRHLADSEPDTIATEQAALALYTYKTGKSPYAAGLNTEKNNNAWIIWTAVGAAAVILPAGGAVFLIKRRKGKLKDE